MVASEHDRQQQVRFMTFLDDIFFILSLGNYRKKINNFFIASFSYEKFIQITLTCTANRSLNLNQIISCRNEKWLW